MTCTFLYILNEATGLAHRMPLQFSFEEAKRRLADVLGVGDQLDESTPAGYVRFRDEIIFLFLFDESTEGQLAEKMQAPLLLEGRALA